MGVRVQTEKGLSDLDRFFVGFGGVPRRLAPAVAVQAVRVDGQQVPLEMAPGTAQETEADLQLLGLLDGVVIEQVMEGRVAGQKGETIDQLEASLAQAARLAQTRDAQGGFMHQLQGQARGDGLRPLAGPAEQQLPGAESQVFGNQQPQADQVARNLVGQQLTHAPFEAERIGRLGPHPAVGSIGFNVACHDPVGPTLVEFFFGSRTRQRSDPRCAC